MEGNRSKADRAGGGRSWATDLLAHFGRKELRELCHFHHRPLSHPVSRIHPTHQQSEITSSSYANATSLPTLGWIELPRHAPLHRLLFLGFDGGHYPSMLQRRGITSLGRECRAAHSSTYRSLVAEQGLMAGKGLYIANHGAMTNSILL